MPDGRLADAVGRAAVPAAARRLRAAVRADPAGPGLPTGAPPPGGAIAAGWPAIKSDNAGTNYHAQIGLLGDEVHEAGGCTMAVGPGAVFGAGNGGGRVDRYVESPDKVTAADWARCPLAAVDVDDLFRAYINAGVDPKGDQVPCRTASAPPRRPPPTAASPRS